MAFAQLVEQAEEAGESGESGPAAKLASLVRVQLRGTATELTLVMGGEEVTGPRAEAGMYARIPDEPAGLFEVVADARDLTVVGREDVDGISATHLSGRAEPKAAVDAGLGTQAQLSIAKLPQLPVQVWLDDDRRPLISYAVELPSLQDGRTRTIVTTYDYRVWGEPVDVTP